MLNNSSLADEDSLIPPYKIILLGKGQAGKTKLLVRYIYGSYTDKGMLTVMIDCSYKKRQNIKIPIIYTHFKSSIFEEVG